MKNRRNISRAVRMGVMMLLCVTLFFPVRAAAASGWNTVTVKTYTKKNGKLATGSYKINGTYYIFDSQGHLATSGGTKVVRVGSKRFLASSSGKALTGWQVVGNNLYYATKKGRLKTSTTYKGITFRKNGKAKMDTNGLAKWQAVRTFSSITNSKMTQSQKLKACWNYLVGGSFRYAIKYPNLSASGWQRSTAYNMLSTRSGNCYSFACAFAALANEAGYKAYVICGRVPGSRDGASDGYTRHAWVRINGRYYDPEAQYAGWMRGVYNSGSYSISHTVQSTVLYW